MKTVLLVDDDASFLDVVSLVLAEAGYRAVRALDGAEALERIDRDAPALVVSDVNMPRLDGFSFCRTLRERGYTMPVILLTSRAGEIDQVLGLELGADDYLAKPFSNRVLLARIAALMRREALRHDETPSPKTTCGALELDPGQLRVHYRGTEIQVTLTEFRLLEALAVRPGQVRSRGQLLEKTRDGDDGLVDGRVIDTYVRRLRRKLEAVEPGFAAIETVIGAGYRWRPTDG